MPEISKIQLIVGRYLLIFSDIAKCTIMKSEKKLQIIKTSIITSKQFLVVFSLADMFRAKHRSLEDFWNNYDTGMDIFPATMSAKRFMFLLTCLRFDNVENRSERWIIDKLAPTEAIFDR